MYFLGREAVFLALLALWKFSSVRLESSADIWTNARIYTSEIGVRALTRERVNGPESYFTTLGVTETGAEVRFVGINKCHR